MNNTEHGKIDHREIDSSLDAQSGMTTNPEMRTAMSPAAANFLGSVALNVVASGVALFERMYDGVYSASTPLAIGSGLLGLRGAFLHYKDVVASRSIR